AQVLSLDLEVLQFSAPVRFLKIRSLDSGGSFPGFEIVGFQALNYRPISRGHYEVAVSAGEIVSGVDFGVAGDDRPPRVFLSADQTGIQAGHSVNVQVTASDDVGLASVVLKI